MPIIVQCPACERKLRVPDELLGKKVKCPGCKTMFTGEAQAPSPPPPPPPPASRERQRPEPRPEPPAPIPPPPTPPPASRERQRPEARPEARSEAQPEARPEARPEAPAPEPPPSTSGGMAALENLGLEDDEPAPPPAKKTPAAEVKPPAPDKIAGLDNLNLELDEEPAPPPPPAKQKEIAPVPSMPVSPSSKGTGIIVECPACARKVRVPNELLGKKVKCPGCAGTFVAQDRAAAPPPSARKPDKLKLELDDKPPPPPPPDAEEMEEISPEPMKPRPVKAKPVKAKAIRDGDDDGKEPCPYCGELIKEGATRCKHCGEDIDDDEYEDDRPSRRGKSKRSSIRRDRRDAAPHRGGVVMTLGIISVCLLLPDLFFCCCFSIVAEAAGLGLGIPAWLMGQKDLAKMRDGLMDSSGQGATNTGYICGMIGTIIHGLFLLLSIGWFIFSVLIRGAAIMGGFGGSSGPPPGQRF